MSVTVAYHVTPRENLPSILSRGLQPRIGERSADLGEPTPRIYLFPTPEDCDTALSSWLGDWFEEVEENGLLILKVDVSDIELDSDAEYELSCSEVIAPSRILEVMSEDWKKIPHLSQQKKLLSAKHEESEAGFSI